RGWAILQLTWEDLTERPDLVLESLSSVLRFPQQTGQEPPKCPQARGYAAPLHLNGSIPKRLRRQPRLRWGQRDVLVDGRRRERDVTDGGHDHGLRHLRRDSVSPCPDPSVRRRSAFADGASFLRTLRSSRRQERSC